jgi:hypothetical protein
VLTNFHPGKAKPAACVCRSNGVRIGIEHQVVRPEMLDHHTRYGLACPRDPDGAVDFENLILLRPNRRGSDQDYCGDNGAGDKTILD